MSSSPSGSSTTRRFATSGISHSEPHFQFQSQSPLHGDQRQSQTQTPSGWNIGATASHHSHSQSHLHHHSLPNLSSPSPSPSPSADSSVSSHCPTGNPKFNSHSNSHRHHRIDLNPTSGNDPDQLLLDEFNRIFAGLRGLVEKKWEEGRKDRELWEKFLVKKKEFDIQHEKNKAELPRLQEEVIEAVKNIKRQTAQTPQIIADIKKTGTDYILKWSEKTNRELREELEVEDDELKAIRLRKEAVQAQKKLMQEQIKILEAEFKAKEAKGREEQRKHEEWIAEMASRMGKEKKKGMETKINKE